MSTIDLSRQATDFRKHYAGVRMQQGRVLTDDDFNEAAALDAEATRRLRLHTIGAYGSPDDGLKPKNFTVVNGKPTFTLSQGNVYLGGLPLALSADQAFHLQKNWLNFDTTQHWPSAPATGQSRIDLVWVEAWEQPVTAVEDRELFEVALGGPDTSVRMRTMHRVQIQTNVTSEECAAAWASAIATTGFSALGGLTAEGEISTNAKLRVTFTAPAIATDLCSPPTAGGYLGAENQAIRVQMLSPTTYTWGYNNAAPLYRVQLSAKNGQLIKITFLTEPKDAVLWPLQNQVVELLPWSSALPNGERVAEVTGHLSQVAVSYNPDDKTLELTTPVPTNFGTQWKTRSDKGEFFDGSTQEEFFYLRVWQRGDDVSSPAAIPITTGTLGNTGLAVSFVGGPLRAGDYWIIAARPAAPDVVTPWLLESVNGAPPHGLKRYRAPIGLVRWTTSNTGAVSGQLIHDCRPPFLPLTKIRNCCSVTVGDGTNSYGQFSSIMAAIQSLPPSGGTVCILPGTYEESVVLNQKRNITLHGCGPRSRIIAQSLNQTPQPAVLIQQSQDITVEGLTLEAGPSAVVQVDNSQAIRLANNLIQVRDIRNAPSVWPAVWLAGQHIEVDSNIIEILPDPIPAQHLQRLFQQTAAAARLTLGQAARGGIQIAGSSQRVRIKDNLITGGIGHGITLGSLVRIDPQTPNGTQVPDITILDLCAPCEPTDNTTPGTTNNPNDPVYRSAGALYDIEIEHNQILRQGANGIGVVRFFGIAQGRVELIAVHGLTIRHNQIIGCLRRPVAVVNTALKYFVGYGGIALALVSELNVEHNDIIDNGIDWRTPVCGVFALMADGLQISHNRILFNGKPSTEPISNVQQGLRAGVHVWLGLSLPTSQTAASIASVTGNATGTLQNSPNFLEGGDQIRIVNNQIDQPLGRALFLLGMGPMQITGNRLVSRGAGTPATDFLANTVVVLNLGLSKEWTLGLLMTLIDPAIFNLKYWMVPPYRDDGNHRYEKTDTGSPV
jgi:hypothetical protein